MKKLKNATLLVCLALTLPVLAQKEKEDDELMRSMFSFGVGYANFEGLNTMLKDGGYPELNNANFDFGILLWSTEGRFHYIFDLGFWSQISKVEASSMYYSGDIKFSIGYSVIQRGRFSLAPYLGVGMDYGYLELTKKEDPSVNTVAGYINAPSYTQRLDSWSIVGATGVYACWDFPSRKSDDLFSIGVHCGYTPRLMKQRWKSGGGAKLKGLSVPGGVSASVLLGVSL